MWKLFSGLVRQYRYNALPTESLGYYFMQNIAFLEDFV